MFSPSSHRLALAGLGTVVLLGGIISPAYANTPTQSPGANHIVINSQNLCEIQRDMNAFKNALIAWKKAYAEQLTATASAWGGSESDIKQNALTQDSIDLGELNALNIFDLKETEKISTYDIDKAAATDVNTMFAAFMLLDSVRSATSKYNVPTSAIIIGAAAITTGIKPELGRSGFKDRLDDAARSITKEFAEATTAVLNAYADSKIDVYNSCAKLLNYTGKKVGRDNFVGEASGGIVRAVSGSSFNRLIGSS